MFLFTLLQFMIFRRLSLMIVLLIPFYLWSWEHNVENISNQDYWFSAEAIADAELPINTVQKNDFSVECLNDTCFLSSISSRQKSSYLMKNGILLLTIPYYQTWWFYLLIIVFILIVVYSFSRAYKNIQLQIVNASILQQSLGTNRLILLFVGLAYPIASIINSFLDDQILSTQLVATISIGAATLSLLATSYYSKLIRRNINWIVSATFVVVEGHIITLLLANNLAPTMIVGFVMITSFASIIFNSLRSYVFFALIVFLLATGVSYISDASYFIRLQFVMISFWTLMIVSVLIIVKLNLSKRLRLSDTILQKGDSIILVSNAKNEIIFASNSIVEKLGYNLEDVYGDGWWRMREKMDGITREELTKNRQYLDGKRLYTNAITDVGGEKKYFNWTDTEIEGGLVIGVGQDVTSLHDYQEELKRLSMVATNTDNYVLITDKENQVLWVNSAFETIFKYNAKDIIGKKTSKFFRVEEFNPKIIKKLRQHVYENKIPFRAELTDVDANGDHIWLAVTVTPIVGEDGDIEQIISLGSDITDKKLDEFRLNEYSKTLELMHDIDNVLMKERTEHQLFNELLSVVKKSNSMYMKVSLMIFDEAIEYSDYYFIDDRSETLSFENGLDLSEMGSLTDIKFKQTYVVQDLVRSAKSVTDQRLLKEGLKSYIMVPLVVGDKIMGSFNVGGRYPFMFIDEEVKVIQDIANSISVAYKQKEQARKIMQSEENFRQLNESLKEVFWFFDQENREMIYVSKAYETIFGSKPSVLMENPMAWMETVVPDDRVRIQRTYLANVFEAGFDEQFQIFHPEKGLKWVHCTAVPIKNNDGEVVKISGFTEDITELKKKEEELSLLNSKLESINNINESILTNEPFGNVLIASLKNLVLGQIDIARLTLSLFDFENDAYSYYRIDDELINVTEDSEKLPLGQFRNVNMLRRGEIVVVSSIKDVSEKSESDKRLLDIGVNSYLQVPLIFDRELIGSLNLGFVEHNEYDDDFKSSLSDIAKGISLSIHQMQLKSIIESDKEELVAKNRDITASINYAKRIQNAYLPDVSFIREFFLDAHLYYKAKDIVSGDFYWWSLLGNKLIIVVADCTGHGVPGGFMTVLGSQTIANIVNSKKTTDPGLLLTQLDEEIQFAINKSEETLGDGMDVGICTVDIDSGELLYAGARTSIHYVSNGELMETKGALKSIGEAELVDVPFNTSKIQLNKGDRLFLFSDGAQDQFGGPGRRRKFSKKQLQGLICEEENLKIPLQKQYDIIVNSIEEWKGDRELTDDITLLALEY